MILWLFLAATIRLENWQAQIDPETLAISGSGVQIAAATERPFPVQNLKQTADSVQWTIPPLGMAVRINSVRNRLHVRFDTSQEQKFTWPVSGADPKMTALIYPDGEGLYIPLGDAFWKRRFAGGPCRDTHGGISVPFWSYQAAGRTLTYLALSDLQTELCFSERAGRLSTYAVHTFRKRDGAAPYELEIWPGGESPVSPAIEYRQWLTERGEYVTLEQKIARNPEVGKLLGAMHAYLFGDAGTPAFLDELQRMGVDRFWLGLQKVDVGAAYIAQAKKYGYLVGPYDSFANIQDSASADSPSSIFDGLYKSGCVMNENGKLKTGFAGRGCELSSEALSQSRIAERVKAHAAAGINSYFLDVDAFGELWDDYSPAHPMTPARDRENRLKRMRYIADTEHLVLGSEIGVAWSAPVIAFGHGIEAVHNALLWPLQKDKATFGRWWPPERPGVFFKPITVTDEFKTARYDPAYRLPLFQAAFHGSVVGTDRWETPYTKFPELAQTRALLEALYNVPAMWSLDIKELREFNKSLSAMYAFFAPIHKRVGAKPLTGFRWLTPDKMVQQTTFAGDVILTANFSQSAYQSVPPHCIEATWLKESRKQLYCPPPV